MLGNYHIIGIYSGCIRIIWVCRDIASNTRDYVGIMEKCTFQGLGIFP